MERFGGHRTESARPTAPAQAERAPTASLHLSDEELTRAALVGLDWDMHDSTSSGSAERGIVWSLERGTVTVGRERPDAFEGGGADVVRTFSRADAIACTPPAARRGRAGHEAVAEAGLVTIELAEHRRVLVDLLAAGVTSLAGDLLDRKAFTRHCADELLERRWAPVTSLVIVGPSTCSEEQLHRGDAIVLDEIAAVLSWLDGVSAPQRRPAREGISRPSTVILVGPGAVGDRAGLAELAQRVSLRSSMGDANAADSRPSIGVLIAGVWPGAGCVLAVGEGAHSATPYLGIGDRRASRATMNVALHTSWRAGSPDGGDDAVVSVVAPDVDEAGPNGADSLPRSVATQLGAFARANRAETVDAAPPSVEVAVLGRIEVRGIDGGLDRRPKLTELVVFLALHPGGATTNSWTTALWPGRRVPLQTVANRLSETRALLGDAPDGRPRLRRAGDVHLVADVSTDWARFQLLAGDQTVEAWREALTLVRGRPFEDLASNLWTAIECLAVSMEREVTECALRTGARLLDAGDLDGASWAAHQGLRACPWDERLHRLLMVVADAMGNRAGVEATLRHLALVLEVEGDPLRRVHPETRALYERLVQAPSPLRS